MLLYALRSRCLVVHAFSAVADLGPAHAPHAHTVPALACSARVCGGRHQIHRTLKTPAPGPEGATSKSLTTSPLRMVNVPHTFARVYVGGVGWSNVSTPPPDPTTLPREVCTLLLSPAPPARKGAQRSVPGPPPSSCRRKNVLPRLPVACGGSLERARCLLSRWQRAMPACGGQYAALRSPRLLDVSSLWLVVAQVRSAAVCVCLRSRRCGVGQGRAGRQGRGE